jgi:Transposase, Mutator family
MPAYHTNRHQVPKPYVISLQSHRARNLLAKVSVHDQDEVKADFWAVFDVGEAEPGDEAIAVAHHQAAAFAAKWQARYPAAVACVTDDLASLTVHLRFPAEHWPRIRHSNLIERTFGETRRRTKVIGRLPGEATCLALVWAVLDRASRGWRGLAMTPRGFGCSRTSAASSSTRPCQRRWSTRPSPLPRNIPPSLRPEPFTPLLGRHPAVLTRAELRSECDGWPQSLPFPP